MTTACVVIVAELEGALSRGELADLPAPIAAHLSGCAHCRARLALLTGQPAAGPFAPSGSSAEGAIRRIVLSRAVLALALPLSGPAAAPTRGSGGDEFVLFEDGGVSSQANLTVAVRDCGDGTWELVVTTSPPLVGRLRVASGDTELTAPFQSDGSATISAIPFALLTEHEAPDLELIILPVGRAGGG